MRSRTSTVTILLFLTFLVGLGVAFWLLPDRTFSEKENRSLQPLPALSAEGWFSGRLTADLNDYYNDQFPARSFWTGVHATTQLAMGRGESNGVWVGADGQLAVRRFDAYLDRTTRVPDTLGFRETHIQGQLHTLAQWASGTEVPVTVLLPPRTVDVVGHTASSDRLQNVIENTLSQNDISHVDLTDTFRQMQVDGTLAYYHTDHHWTTLGAYTAYRAIMDAWDMAPNALSADTFTVRAIPDFYGTTAARAALPHTIPDTIEIWTAPDDSDYGVYDEQGQLLLQGFIDESRLTTRDKYAAFLGGNRRIILVTKVIDAPRPRLLVAKDSFANCLIPFLARHFDIVAVNLSADMTDLSDYVAAYECDRVLIVYNWENLVTADHLGRVK